MNDRKQFEAWSMSEEGGAWKPMWFVNSEDGYAHEELRKMWHTWQAARATPAQPVPNETFMESLDARILEATNKAFDCGEFQMDAEDGDSVTAYRLIHEKQKESVERLKDFVIAAIAPAKPSPSSVGAAIRALPLPDTELTTKIGMFEVRAWTKSHIGDIQHAAAEIAEKAMPQKSAVEKMLEINQLDELGHEVARLQRALCFWLPSVVDCDGEVAERIFQDAFLLDGIDGNVPDDFKTAQELGWITLSEAAALAEQHRSEDTILLDWFDQQCTAYGFEGVQEGNEWLMNGPFATLRQALRECMAGDPLNGQKSEGA